jgi:hypothetical protein
MPAGFGVGVGFLAWEEEEEPTAATKPRVVWVV